MKLLTPALIDDHLDPIFIVREIWEVWRQLNVCPCIGLFSSWTSSLERYVKRGLQVYQKLNNHSSGFFYDKNLSLATAFSFQKGKMASCYIIA
ncbi:hypothetical protein [Pseudomonas sp. Marseille-QA0332]